MKIRKGFVTNSSSSSFIVEFEKLPSSADELQEMMFGNEKFMEDDWGESYSTHDIAKRVFEDMQRNGSISITDIVNEYDEFYDESMPDEWDYSDKDAYTLAKAVWEATSPQAADIRHKFGDLSKVFYFEYSDNDGSFDSMMEHGHIFRNVKHDSFGHH